MRRWLAQTPAFGGFRLRWYRDGATARYHLVVERRRTGREWRVL